MPSFIAREYLGLAPFLLLLSAPLGEDALAQIAMTSAVDARGRASVDAIPQAASRTEWVPRSATVRLTIQSLYPSWYSNDECEPIDASFPRPTPASGDPYISILPGPDNLHCYVQTAHAHVRGQEPDRPYDGATDPSLVGESMSKPAGRSAHYEYVFPDGNIYIYDMDNNFALVKHRSLPTNAGVRGVVGHAKNHRLYISFGSDGRSGGRLLAYDLIKDRVIWQRSYSLGIDSMALTPDGARLYMPDGEASSLPYWYVIDVSDGRDTGIRINGGPGPHNTIVSLNGRHVYTGARNFSDAPTSLTVADVSTNGRVRDIGPFRSGIRPFTITGEETLAYVAMTNLLGFQVADIRSGKVICTVDLTKLGFPNHPTGPSAPSHGIALSPDEARVAVIDWPNDMVHIFDVSRVPASAPKKVADIKLTRSMHHNESPCAYDCLADGWLSYSRDGRFLFVGDEGDVIDARTNVSVANLDALYNSRIMLEVDWRNGVPSFVPTNRASVGYVAH